MPYSVITRTGVHDIKYRKRKSGPEQDLWLNNIRIGTVVKGHRNKGWLAFTYSDITPYAFSMIRGFSNREAATDYIIMSYKNDGLGRFMFNHERIRENFLRTPNASSKNN